MPNGARVVSLVKREKSANYMAGDYAARSFEASGKCRDKTEIEPGEINGRHRFFVLSRFAWARILRAVANPGRGRLPLLNN